jgi:DNA segregation ATPase FtsK/SpoIIIE, S-DNA-T family
LGYFRCFSPSLSACHLFLFFFTWHKDQSVLELPLLDFFFDSNVEVYNWGAKLGAYISKLFIHDTFGISSFSFVYVFFALGLRFLKIKIVSLRKSIKFMLLWIVVASIALGYTFGAVWDANIGGAHGYYVSQWIASLIGFVPTGLVIFSLVFVSSIYSFPAFLPFVKSLLSIDSLFAKGGDTPMQSAAQAEPAIEPGINEHTPSQPADDFAATQQPDSQPAFDVEGLHVEQASGQAQEKIKGEPEFSFEHAPEDEASPIENPEIPCQAGEWDQPRLDPEFDITNAGLEVEMADEINNQPEGDYDPTADLSHYRLPPIDLLEDYQSRGSKVTEIELVENKNKIVETLQNYKIQIDKIKATIGPTVTLYEIVPAPGVRISKIKSLEDDIALSLAALGIRIIAPIPGKGTIGIEVPNQHPEVVSMRSIIASKSFQETTYDLPLALGKTISNETYCADLAKMPHLLIAGATGQGKSVGLNAVLTSLLYKKHPSQLKFVLIDPKKVELTLYQKIENHYLAMLPGEDEAIITDTQKVVNTLNSLCIEMDTRYDLLKQAKQRNLKEYNERFIKRRLNPLMGHRFMPYIVVVIDEFADLIMTAGKEVELPLARLAQLARAIGIHLIIATQRPTTNIITGVIKANFPSRIAFRVSSSMDSRTILDSPGANQLIGKGDMLISQGSDMIRVQCAFVDTPELERITDYIGKQQSYGSPLFLPEYSGNNSEGGGPTDVDLEKRDSLFEDAARLLVIHQQGSTSLIQRKFSIGYNRAGRIVDQLEVAGIVGPFEGSKARQVLCCDEASLDQLLSRLP